jgi:hypothetical protein
MVYNFFYLNAYSFFSLKSAALLLIYEFITDCILQL